MMGFAWVGNVRIGFIRGIYTWKTQKKGEEKRFVVSKLRRLE